MGKHMKFWTAEGWVVGAEAGPVVDGAATAGLRSGRGGGGFADDLSENGDMTRPGCRRTRLLLPEHSLARRIRFADKRGIR